MIEKLTNPDCSCHTCKKSCANRPGWFKHGEAEKVAAFMNITFEELFRKWLGVDWLNPTPRVENTTFLLAPRLMTMNGGEEYPGNPRGRCVFFTDGRCKIHPVKPIECKMMDCRVIQETNGKITDHVMIGESWVDHQDQIRLLLGREPKYYFGGIWE